jgi:5-methylcytosine-specific restriction endonuclease McrA
MRIEEGKKYYHKRGPRAVVREVLAVDGGQVAYRVLHGPALKRQPHGRCGLRRFERWADGEFAGDDYARLDGAVLRKTFVVLSVAGQPIFRCSQRRADFYLRKGYARQADAGTLRMVDDQTERKLQELYRGQFSEFFLAVKNDRCCVCGRTHDLTRHHVVPRRHKKKLPLELRSRLSNVLFVCSACHADYEGRQLVSDSTDPYVWKDHFIRTMNPQFIPPGWDILSIKEASA